MNARGTRRPHPRRVRSKPRVRKVKTGGGICGTVILAPAAVLLVVPLVLALLAGCHINRARKPAPTTLHAAVLGQR